MSNNAVCVEFEPMIVDSGCSRHAIPEAGPDDVVPNFQKSSGTLVTAGNERLKIK